MWNQWWGGWLSRKQPLSRDTGEHLSSALSPVCPEEQGAGVNACCRRFSGLSGVVILRAGTEHPLT